MTPALVPGVLVGHATQDYEEMKTNGVVSQGWKYFGNLAHLIALRVSDPANFESALRHHAHSLFEEVRDRTRSTAADEGRMSP